MYDNQFDFDDASNEWRKNKKQQPNGITNGKQCRRSTISSVIKNNYIYGFGGYTFDKYTHHPNKNYYCKRHINRRLFIVS